MELLKKAYSTVRKYSMLSRGDRVLIGLSGGADSVCLTVFLYTIREDLDLILHAVYVDHGLRPEESEKEKSFCRSFCEGIGIEFSTIPAEVTRHAAEKKLNRQEAARQLRYAIYEKISREVNAQKVATGHTADDQVETFLMRLVRGSGAKGLSVIPPVRRLSFSARRPGSDGVNDIVIIRPMIEVEREEIERFLIRNSSRFTSETSGPYMVDSSNLRQDYFRNWMRQTVITELKKRNPALVRDICRTADILREEYAYLELIVTKTLMRLISRKSSDSIELFLAPLETMEKPLLRRVLRRAIGEVEGLRGIDFIHIEDMIQIIRTGKQGDVIRLPKEMRAIKEYSVFRITSKTPVTIAEWTLQPPGEIHIKDADVRIRAVFEDGEGVHGNERTTTLLDAGAMKFPLRIRARAAGDFFYPAGFGKRKKLQDFFVDEKVPRDRRNAVPIVVSGSDIVWVAGYRADERFRVTEKTEKFLRLIISKGSA